MTDVAPLTLGEYLRTRREALGITQEQLATEIGVTQQAVDGWERGRYRPATSRLYALANALGVYVAELWLRPGARPPRRAPRRPRRGARGVSGVGTRHAVVGGGSPVAVGCSITGRHPTMILTITLAIAVPVLALLALERLETALDRRWARR